LLNAVDGITVYRDFLHIARLPHMVRVDSLTARLTLDQKKAVIRHFEAAEITRRAEGVSGLAPGDFETLIDFYIRILAQIARPGDLVVGHKTTSAHDALDTLLQHVPGLKVVYVLRDPRDVTLSAVKRFPHQAWSVHVARWQRAHETMTRLQARDDVSSRIHVVRFEQLLLEPDSSLSSLAHFLGVDEIREPDAMTDYGREWQDNSSFGDLRSTATRQSRLGTAPVGRWREKDPALGRMVELLLHDLMADAGFELSAPIRPGERRRAELAYHIDRLAQLPRTAIERARRKVGGSTE
jgi:hypothetical protein